MKTFARWEKQPDSLTLANGEAGDGVYAFFDSDRVLDLHYREPERRRVRFTLIEGATLIDLRKREHRSRIAEIAKEIGCGIKVTLRNMERAYWSITTYMERHAPDCAAYIVPHITPTTNSVQIVVRKPEAIIEL